MKKRMYTKLVHEGKYVAEVDIELIDAPEGWSPYLALEDAYSFLPFIPKKIIGRAFLEPMGISRYRLGKCISVRPRRINDIVNEKRIHYREQRTFLLSL